MRLSAIVVDVVGDVTSVLHNRHDWFVCSAGKKKKSQHSV